MDSNLDEDLAGSPRHPKQLRAITVGGLAVVSLAAIVLFGDLRWHAAGVHVQNATVLALVGCLLNHSASLPAGHYGLAIDFAKQVRRQVYGPGEEGPFNICVTEALAEFPATLTYHLNLPTISGDANRVTIDTRLTSNLNTQKLYHTYETLGLSSDLNQTELLKTFGQRSAESSIRRMARRFKTRQYCENASEVREAMQDALSQSERQQVFDNFTISEMSFWFSSSYHAVVCQKALAPWRLCGQKRKKCEAQIAHGEQVYEACQAHNRNCDTTKAFGGKCRLHKCTKAPRPECQGCPTKREFLDNCTVCGQNATSFGC